MKYLYIPKGGDIGFPNTVILSFRRCSPHSRSASRFVFTRFLISFGVTIIYYILYFECACTQCAGEIIKKC